MLASWTKRGCETAHEMAIERLVQLRAFVEVESHSSEEGKKEENASKGGGFIVHEHFRKHVKRAIERGFEDLDDEEEEEKENEGGEKKKKKKKANVKTTTTTTTTTSTTRFNEEDAGFLDHYAKSRWETVLLLSLIHI